MIQKRWNAPWLPATLVLLAACSPLDEGAWGSSVRDASWSTHLADDPSSRMPGVTSGALSKVDLLVGELGVVRIALWSNGDGHDYSSGGGSDRGCSMEGRVVAYGAELAPFSFHTSDGVRVDGSIGDQVYSFDTEAMFLVAVTADGVVSKQLSVTSEALASLDIDNQAEREAFAAEWKITEFFEAATGR